MLNQPIAIYGAIDEHTGWELIENYVSCVFYIIIFIMKTSLFNSMTKGLVYLLYST